MIELITTSLFIFTSLYGGPAMAAMPTVEGNQIPEKITTNIPTREELEEKAKVYFKEDPLLVDIARCESHFRQYDEKGNVLRGKVNKGDMGIMQINEYYHGEKAKSLGYDLETVDGNMAYAKYLYGREGGQPWISSSACWNQKNQVATL